jgi:hypothetical protein
MVRLAKKGRSSELSTSMPSTEITPFSQSLDASLDESSADELGPETEEQASEIASTPAKLTPKKRGRPSLASRVNSTNSPPSENDIVVKERDGHKIKLVLYNQFRCGRCKTSGQDCVVEIGRKGSHVVRCDLCIARNQSVTQCTLPLHTLLDLDKHNPHLEYTINKLENVVKKNGQGVQFASNKKEGSVKADVSTYIPENRLREAKARLNSLRKACELNGDKLIASQLEDIISECLSENA